MTTYFDAAAQELRDIVAGRRVTDFIYSMEQLEKRVVHDCTVAAMSDGFPVDLRPRIHWIVLRHGVTTLPRNAEPADFETNEQHASRIRDLIDGLHDTFHAVASRGIQGLNDNPRSAVNAVYDRGDTERERLVAGEPFEAILASEDGLGLTVVDLDVVLEALVGDAMAAGAAFEREGRSMPLDLSTRRERLIRAHGPEILRRLVLLCKAVREAAPTSDPES